MRSRRRNISSFDQLMATRYGQPDPRLLRHAATAVRDLLERHYGELPEILLPANAKASMTLSVECDDGRALLEQRRRLRSATDTGIPEGPHDYIGPLSLPDDLPPQVEQAKAAEPAAAPAATPPPAVESTPQPVPPMAAPQTHVAGEEDRVSENELLADMKSILSGQSVYDPVRGRTIPKSGLKEYPREPAEPEPEQEKPRQGAESEASNSQSIFDRIAKSMQHAGAYDLGEVELENRFSDFDRMDDLRTHGAAKKPRDVSKAQEATIVEETRRPDTADFLADLDAIREQGQAGLVSSPMYDTGEHIMAGAELYVDKLQVGKPPGVLFSYGELIAMADLFATVDDMMAADTAELSGLKALLQQSLAYYKAGKPKKLYIEDTKWQAATKKRYGKLAEDNFEHFSPFFIFNDRSFRTRASQRNHKLRWEEHHKRAIEAAQRMAADPANRNKSYIPVYPLIVNAFGDHFLTDAFAGGHVINKAEVMEYFKFAFYSGGKLTDAGKSFFNKVAERAWKGDLPKKFSKYEFVQTKYGVHWDINSASRFAEFLKGAAEQVPDHAANLAVKTLHDELNREGIEVVNAKGKGKDKPWRLTGDGHLTGETLEVMRQAVLRSANDITDPSILASNLQFATYFARVWDYVPQLTPASAQKVKSRAVDLLSPASTQLMDAAAGIITEQTDFLIEMAKDMKAIQPA